MGVGPALPSSSCCGSVGVGPALPSSSRCVGVIPDYPALGLHAVLCACCHPLYCETIPFWTSYRSVPPRCPSSFCGRVTLFGGYARVCRRFTPRTSQSRWDAATPPRACGCALTCSILPSSIPPPVSSNSAMIERLCAKFNNNCLYWGLQVLESCHGAPTPGVCLAVWRDPAAGSGCSLR